MIAIKDTRNTSVNGSPVGAFVNAFQESKDPVACQLALEAYCDGLLSDHAAALATKDAEIAALNDYIARVGQVKQAIFEVIQNPEIDAVATTAAITTIIEEGEKPEADRIRAEKLEQFEALKAELGI